MKMDKLENSSLAICRCCLSNDGSKDLTTKYGSAENEEVFIDMLKETFNVEIEYGPRNSSNNNRLICDVCIVKLRQSYQFKQQVLRSEEKFIKKLHSLKKELYVTVSKLSNESEETSEIKSIKDECNQNESSDDEPLVFRLDDEATEELEFLDEAVEQLAKLKSNHQKEPQRRKKMKRKASPIAESLVKKVKLEPDSEQAEYVTDITVAADSMIPDNTLILLENSNICPFEFVDAGTQITLYKYKCFLCKETFDDITVLKEHSRSHNPSELVIKILRSKMDEKINAETSNIKCQICNEEIANLTELMSHLDNKHSLVLEEKAVHNLLPFKLIEQGFRCQMCGVELDSFETLLKHTLTHVKSVKTCMMCEVCGKVFECERAIDAKRSLDRHTVVIHGQQTRTPHKKKYNIQSNALNIILSSNACPFHWPKNKHKLVKCYCCAEHFDDFPSLRQHIDKAHNINNLEKEIRTQVSLIKIDITDLRCKECNQLFRDLDDFKDHIAKEHLKHYPNENILLPMKIEIDGYKCQICSDQFNNWFTLNKHIRSAHIPNKAETYICDDCGKKCTTRRNLVCHMYHYHLGAQKEMSKVDAQRENTAILLQHSTMYLFRWDGSLYRCFCCEEKFYSVRKLKEHSQKYTLDTIKARMKKIMFRYSSFKAEITNMRCNICNKLYENIDTLRDHLIEEHRISFHRDGQHYLLPFYLDGCLRCGFCKEECSSFQGLTRHVNAHISSVFCEKCGSSFVNESALKCHKRRIHAPIRCDLCDIVFENFADRKAHNKLHKGKRQRKARKCLYCPLMFTYEENRYIHMSREHGLVRNQYKCDECLREFFTRSAYTSHVAGHARITSKDLRCGVCKVAFYKQYKLDQHIQLNHTELKKYQCMLCDEAFVTINILKIHMADHCKDFTQCVHCGKKFKQRNILLKHLAAVHNLVDPK